MSIEDLKKSVEMWVWDDGRESLKVKREIPFIHANGMCMDLEGIWWGNYGEIKEPTYRPYNETDDLSLLVGKVVKSKHDEKVKYIISGVRVGKFSILMGGQWADTFLLFESFVFLDNTPCGVLNE